MEWNGNQSITDLKDADDLVVLGVFLLFKDKKNADTVM